MYNVKDFGKIKTIIGLQVTLEKLTIKIAELVFIFNLIDKKSMYNCNSKVYL